MRFYVVVAFHNEPLLLDRCLNMLARQDDDDFTVLVADDDSRDDGVNDVLLHYVCQDLDWAFYFHRQRFGTLRNQVNAIRATTMEPDDVIVFCDGDDRLAGPYALSTLRTYYKDNVDLTYGSYEPRPPDAGCAPASPIPHNTCAAGNYRRWARMHGARWNHLRTMRRRIFDAIPDDHIHDGNDWPMACADLVLMTPAFELAGGRHRFIDEVLYEYTSDRQDSDWRINAPEISRVHRWVFNHKPLKPLESR